MSDKQRKRSLKCWKWWLSKEGLGESFQEKTKNVLAGKWRCHLSRIIHLIMCETELFDRSLGKRYRWENENFDHQLIRSLSWKFSKKWRMKDRFWCNLWCDFRNRRNLILKWIVKIVFGKVTDQKVKNELNK